MLRFFLPCTIACSAAVLVLLIRRRARRSVLPNFDIRVDRSDQLTVKHGLAPCIFAEAGPGTLPLWVADMDLPCCPRICAAMRERCDHPTFGYTYQPEELWRAVGRWLVEHQGWQVAPPPSSFVFSASAVSSFVSLVRAFTAVGDSVLVMTPLYAPLQDAVAGEGRKLVRCPLRLDADGRYHMDVEGRLDEALRADGGAALLLLCNPQNPSGRMWGADELRRLAAACARHGV